MEQQHTSVKIRIGLPNARFSLITLLILTVELLCIFFCTLMIFPWWNSKHRRERNRKLVEFMLLFYCEDTTCLYNNNELCGYEPKWDDLIWAFKLFLFSHFFVAERNIGPTKGLTYWPLAAHWPYEVSDLLAFSGTVTRPWGYIELMVPLGEWMSWRNSLQR